MYWAGEKGPKTTHRHSHRHSHTFDTEAYVLDLCILGAEETQGPDVVLVKRRHLQKTQPQEESQ